LNDSLVIKLFNSSLGKKFWNNGKIYEGEWKDGKAHGQGKSIDLLNDSLVLKLFNASLGNIFWNNGNRYEGEWKDDKMYGQGK